MRLLDPLRLWCHCDDNDQLPIHHLPKRQTISVVVRRATVVARPAAAPQINADRQRAQVVSGWFCLVECRPLVASLVICCDGGQTSADSVCLCWFWKPLSVGWVFVWCLCERCGFGVNTSGFVYTGTSASNGQRDHILFTPQTIAISHETTHLLYWHKYNSCLTSLDAKPLCALWGSGLAITHYNHSPMTYSALGSNKMTCNTIAQQRWITSLPKKQYI